MPHPFDLVAVGGTGQAFLLELCRGKQARGDAAPFPNRYWIVDADTDTREPGGELSLSGVLSDHLADHGFANHLVKPDIPGNLDNPALLKDAFSEGWGILDAALTTGEKSRVDVRNGFFAIPRLAAVWTSKNELQFGDQENFFDAKYLGMEKDGALVIAGSLAGGTGAGLLPMLLNLSRSSAVPNWKRPVIVLAFLPWFNPELAPGAGPGARSITWEQCRHNAAFGILALEHKIKEFKQKLTDASPTPDTPFTCAALCGIPINEAKKQAPLNFAAELPVGTVHPIFRVAADAVEFLSTPPEAVLAFDATTLARIGTVIAPMSQTPKNWHGIEWGGMIPDSCLTEFKDVKNKQACEVEADGSVVLALQRVVDADLPLLISGLFDRTAGYGTVLSGILRSSQGKDRETGMIFLNRMIDKWRAYINANKKFERLDSHIDRVVNMKKIVEILNEWGGTPSTTEGVTWVDQCIKLASHTTRDTPKNLVEQNADKVAEQLINALRSHYFSEAEKQRKKDASSDKRSAILDPDVFIGAVTDGDKTEVQFFPDGSLDSSKIYQVYKLPGPTTCPSQSYATALGLSHVLARAVTSLNARPVDNQPIGYCLLLWRALIRNKLTIVSDSKNLSVIEKTENASQFLGGLDGTAEPKLLSYRGIPVGFWTAEMGCVPHADMVDECGEFGNLHENGMPQDKTAKAFDSMSDELADTMNDDFEILRAFAVYRGGPQIKADFTAAWRQLLLRCSDSFKEKTEATKFLSKYTIPYNPSFLYGDNSTPEQIPVPLALEQNVLAAVKKVSTTDSPGFTVDESGFRFSEFNDTHYKKIASLVKMNSSSIVIGIEKDNLLDAAASVGVGLEKARIKIDW